MFTLKLKGGALYIAIFLSLVIALLLSMLILMSYYHTIDYDQFLIEDKVQTNANSALNYAIYSSEELIEPSLMDLYGDGDDSVMVKTRWWGCYKSVAVKAFKKNYSIQYNCLVGEDLPTDTCLICPGRSKPISVSGKTLFKGTCLLPEQGVKTAYVDGQNFIGDRPVDGKIYKANSMPELDKGFLTRSENLVYSYSSMLDSSLSLELFFEKDSIKNSFLSKSLYIHQDGVLILSNKIITGNVIIHASRKIIVEASASLKDVLLIAPKIEIKEKFSGSLQAFASDTIKTGKEVVLDYPSSLVVLNKKTSSLIEKQPSIFIDENNSINGQVIVVNTSTDISSLAYLRISKDSKVMGTVYCNGYLDIQASVFGLVVANSFLLVTPSSVYENHVLNATINRLDLSRHFVGGMMHSNNRKKSIAKWIN